MSNNTKVSICVGKYAQNPYGLKHLGIKVYSIEELCYAMKENAFLLDGDIMSDELIAWIEKECGLLELSKKLYPLVHKKGTLSSFVAMIQEYTGFYDYATIQSICQTLKRGAGLNVLEKRKSRIDYLLKQGQIMVAIREYDILLKEWQIASEEGHPLGTDLKSALLHNKGVALSMLMMYCDAADCFFQAYEIDHSEESFASFLGAKRLFLTETDYVALVSSFPEMLSASLALEEKMETLSLDWQDSETCKSLEMLEDFLFREQMEAYQEECSLFIQKQRSEYRKIVRE
ncbi:hypothetical protein LJC58_00795 [Lachnospiraceae bacterium OttesenSCG-928-D06]|nr:hypothetical protein [Lachnospiraceae bacterium OttesenSCG-928-D06]